MILGRKVISYLSLAVASATWLTCSKSEMEPNIVLWKTKSTMALVAKILRKGFCCLCTFKKSSREEAMPGPCLSMRITCQMSTGAWKPFLHSIRFTRYSSQTTNLLCSRGVEEEIDLFQVLKTLYFEMAKTIYKTKRLMNSLKTANRKTLKINLTWELKIISKRKQKLQ